MVNIARTRKRNRKQVSCLAIALSCTSAMPLMAADLEEIIVTASRRAENTQDVATSIRTFTGEQVAALGISRATDIAALTPGLNAKYSFGSESPIFTMRGIGLNDYSSINNPAVGVYVDDVFVPYIPMMSGQIFDIERIEVLKGPQGTLYGRNTTGGALKFISRKPTRETTADVRVDYGSWETIELEAGVGGALSDTVSARVAGFTRQRGDGFQYNRVDDRHYGQQDRVGGRVILDWTPNEAFNAELNLHGGRDRADTPLREHVGFADPVTGAIPCAAILAGQRGGAAGNCTDRQGYADNDSDPYAYDINNFYGGKISSRSYGANLTLNWDVWRTTLTSVSGYDRYHRDLADDLDGSPFIQFETKVRDDIDVFSQELRLVSDESWDAKWVAGVFYSHDNVENISTQAVDRLYSTRVRVSNDQTTESLALFANLEYPLSEQWSVTGGIRGTKEEKVRWTRSEDLAELGNISVLNPTGGPFVFVTDEKSLEDDDLSGNLGLTFRPSDDLMVYGTASRGFKSGGFKGNISFNPLQVGPYQPEELFAYELGFKSTLLDGSMRFNAAAYYYDWKDFQAYSLVQLAIPVVVLTNAGDAEVKGFEAELTWQALDNLQLAAAGNVLNAEIVEFRSLPGGQDNTGKKLANTPEVSFSGMARYDLPKLGDRWEPYIQALVTYQSKVFFEIQNNPINSQDAYWLANLRLGATSDDGKWEIAAWSRNLFDEEYVAEARYVDLRVFPNANNYGEPRSYGLSVMYSY